MKRNKKIILLSVAALMTVMPLVAVGKNNIPTALAASKKVQNNTIKLRSSDYPDESIQLYTRSGAQYSGNRTLKPGATIRVYGQPVMIRGHKIRLDTGFPPTRIINGQSYYWLGDNGYIKTHNIGSFDNNGYYGVMFNSSVYDKNGKKLKTYRGGSAYVKKNSKIKYLGKTYTYNPAMYYNIGNGLCVKANDVAKANGKNIMRIGYNSYLYNKNGKRIRGQKKLVKGSVIAYSSKTIPTNDKTAAYYFYQGSGKNSKAYRLSYKTIKGQKYYNLGQGRYINAANVDMINGKYVFTNLPTYVVPVSDMYVLNDKLENTDQVVRRGQKVKVDGAITDGEGDNTELYYRLAGTKDRYLWWGDNSEFPEDTFNEGYFTMRFNIAPSSTLTDLTQSYINFKSNKSTPLYTINGTKLDLGSSYLYIPAHGNQSADQNYDVDSKWYIYNKATKQTELYYHLRNCVFTVENPHPAKGEKYNSEQNLGDSFVKAADVDLYGVKIPTMNTAAEAQSQANEIATASQKASLNTYINDAASVRTSEKYRLTTKANRENYDGAIKDAQAAIQDKQATVFQINELKWLLDKTQKALDGAKVKVNDVNNLTSNEASRVQKVMTNANSSLPGFIGVEIYQHWAHKAGYYPKYVWTSSQKSVFMLCRSGYKNQILNVKDYATDK